MKVKIHCKIKESQSGHPVIIDKIEGSPEQVVDHIMTKYIGRNGLQRLGSMIHYELKR